MKKLNLKRIKDKKWIAIFAVVVLTSGVLFLLRDVYSSESGVNMKCYGIDEEGRIYELRDSLLKKQTILDTEGNKLVGIVFCPFLKISEKEIGTKSEIEIVYITKVEIEENGNWKTKMQRPSSEIDGVSGTGYKLVGDIRKFIIDYDPTQKVFKLEDPVLKSENFKVNGFSPFLIAFDEGTYGASPFNKFLLYLKDDTKIRFSIEAQIFRSGNIEKTAQGVMEFQITYSSEDPTEYTIEIDFDGEEIEAKEYYVTITALEENNKVVGAIKYEEKTFTSTLSFKMASIFRSLSFWSDEEYMTIVLPDPPIIVTPTPPPTTPPPTTTPAPTSTPPSIQYKFHVEFEEVRVGTATNTQIDFKAVLSHIGEGDHTLHLEIYKIVSGISIKVFSYDVNITLEGENGEYNFIGDLLSTGG